MGYYSRYELTIHGKVPANLHVVMAKEIPNYFDDPDYVQSLLVGDMSEVKWYDYLTDMGRVSLHYPDTLFEIHRIGEDAEQTKVYFKNGKSQVEEAVITFGECGL